MRLVALISAYLMGLLMGGIGVYAITQPYCPTEDSCVMVREDKKSKIKEIIP